MFMMCSFNLNHLSKTCLIRKLRFSFFLSTNGTSHLTFPPRILEHNGYSECHHRYIVETSSSRLPYTSMPLSYWSSIFTTAVYFINHLPIPTLHFSSHMSNLLALYQTTPNFVVFVVFVIHGFNLIHLTNLLIVHLLVLLSFALLLKVVIYVLNSHPLVSVHQIMLNF